MGFKHDVIAVGGWRKRAKCIEQPAMWEPVTTDLWVNGRQQAAELRDGGAGGSCIRV